MTNEKDEWMNALLVRVGADQSRGGGFWNGLVDSQSGKFAYVSIPENSAVHPGTKKPYSTLELVFSKFGTSIPPDLRTRHKHLDPDFEHLTYGDAGERAKQLRKHLSSPRDLIVFYAGLRDVAGRRELVYAIIGVFVVEAIIFATDIPDINRDINAHSRRILSEGAKDVIIRARPGISGRLERCQSIGEWRDEEKFHIADILKTHLANSFRFTIGTGELPESRIVNETTDQAASSPALRVVQNSAPHCTNGDEPSDVPEHY
jgi:hypothetical protein